MSWSNGDGIDLARDCFPRIPFSSFPRQRVVTSCVRKNTKVDFECLDGLVPFRRTLNS